MKVEAVKKLVDERDAAQAKAQRSFDEARVALQTDFEKQQKLLAESFMAKEAEALRSSQAAWNHAMEAFDAGLRRLEAIDAGVEVDDSRTWTAEQVARLLPAAEIKRLARNRGLSMAGNEAEVAQRLLDAGWRPS